MGIAQQYIREIQAAPSKAAGSEIACSTRSKY